ncbi:MAG: hypothetical protein ABEN55_06210, partial [Bradymonadaceae bacterium]
MATTLWDKFKQSIRWVVSTTEAGVAVIQRADSTQQVRRLLDAQGSTTSAPSQSDAGASIAGRRTTNLFYRHATGGDTSKVAIWLYIPEDGVSSAAAQWHRWGELTLDQDEDILDPFDLEGGWRRIYAEVTQAPGDTLT